MKLILSDTYTCIFNHSLSSGQASNDRCLANIFLLHEKGAKNSPENYRPISLTSFINKLLECIVYFGTSQFLDKNNILIPWQIVLEVVTPAKLS